MPHVEISNPFVSSPLGPEIAALYPEVAVAGSLDLVLQAELRRVGFDLAVVPSESPGWRYVGATVRNDRRYVSILLAIKERWFSLQFWERGVMMASGGTVELDAAAGAVGLWQSGATLRDLRNGWSFVRYSELAEAYEHGDPVAVTWKSYRRTRASHIDHDLIEAAYAQPRLRVLFPFTSHESLRLSRCTRFPYSRDLPVIWPLKDGRYRVVRQGIPHREPVELGLVDTPDEAVALLVAHLPDNCGPAIDGTAEDLDRTDSTETSK
ncbi:DUF6193 family natural product biosynthesis protein [Nocardia arthritidis]|uniref:Uncharacterized protein n=1 Tax=Nocardia arthritidis TaxID=228602 RepID=A0A6G9YET8_9NOCA|nr:DUF6193 family natural product biosynthesis protein [Nocardia arthritidis]QIS11556.1 hypothetical protein F5544_18410 [Nocardia arthritidis]